MDYAIVETGGKQYRVFEGAVLDVERLPGEPGEAIELDRVLLIRKGDRLWTGQPYLAEARVRAEIVDQFRDRKILVFKKKRRKNYKRLRGHRQDLTRIRIATIQAPEG